MRARRVVLVLGVLGVLGCAARSGSRAPAPVDAPPVAPLSLAMLGESGSALAHGDVLDRLFEAPEVRDAGSRLLSRVGAEPSLAPLYDGLVARVFQDPAFLAALRGLAPPGSPLEEVTGIMLARLSASIEGPAFDAALDGALDHLFGRPEVDAAFERLAEALVAKARFSERIAALVLRWRPELEGVVGLAMTDEAFSARFQQHLAEPGRAGAIRQLFADRMVDDPGVRAGLAALLDDEAFARACAELVRAILSHPSFQVDAAAVVAGMVEQIDGVELGQRIDRTLVTPTSEAAVVAFLGQVVQSAAFDALSDRLGRVLDDPNLQAELLSIVAGAPAGHSA